MGDIARAGAHETQTLEDQLRNLRASVIRLDELIQRAKADGDTLTAKRLGIEKAATQDAIQPLVIIQKNRNRLKSAAEMPLEHYFYMVAKKLLPSDVYRELRIAALKKKAENLPPGQREGIRAVILLEETKQTDKDI